MDRTEARFSLSDAALAVFIRANNALTRLRRVRVAPGNLLLLAPHCLQFSDCGRKVARDVDECRRCGQCDLADLLVIRDRYGVLCSLAGGGRQALGMVRNPEVKAVVAVACERELGAGIRAAFPKPVLAVPNTRPRGPCKDTRVDPTLVCRAIESMLVGLPSDAQQAAQAPEQPERNPVGRVEGARVEPRGPAQDTP